MIKGDAGREDGKMAVVPRQRFGLANVHDVADLHIPRSHPDIVARSPKSGHETNQTS